MTLASLEDLAIDLACPRCRSRLTAHADGYGCTSSSCGLRFHMAGSQPILVDFDESILVEDDVRRSEGASAIRRGRRSLRGKIARILLPSNRAAAANAARFLKLAATLSEQPKILIVGGGSRGEGTEQLYADGKHQLIAFDIYTSDLTQFIADAHCMPLADGSVDAVWIQAVLEHVLDPWRVAEEIHRVLRPGGIVYAETPFMQQVHEGAFDFTRFTESGHRWLFRRFDMIESGVVLGPASQLLWSIEHVIRGVSRSVTAGVIAKTMFFWLGYLDRLIPPNYASDGASAVYFLGRRSEATISPRGMLGFYRGANARQA